MISTAKISQLQLTKDTAHDKRAVSKYRGEKKRTKHSTIQCRNKVKISECALFGEFKSNKKNNIKKCFVLLAMQVGER